MCKAGERGRSSDQRARVEGSCHAFMNCGQFDLKDQNEGMEQTYARPSVLKRSSEPHDKGERRKQKQGTYMLWTKSPNRLR